MQRLYECLPQDALHACDSRKCLIVNELRGEGDRYTVLGSSNNVESPAGVCTRRALASAAYSGFSSHPT